MSKSLRSSREVSDSAEVSKISGRDLGVKCPTESRSTFFGPLISVKCGLASHADVLWLVTRSSVTSLRTSASEAKCGPDGGGWRLADGKIRMTTEMQMIKRGWKNADDKMRE